MKLSIKRLKMKHLVLIVVIIIVIPLIYFSLPRFPIYGHDINITGFNQCLGQRWNEWEGDVVPGDIFISFTELTMNDEAKQLLNKYGFDLSGIHFYNDYYLVMVDFTGNEPGFIEYLENLEYVLGASRRDTGEFIVRFGPNFPKKQLSDIINSYDGITVNDISYGFPYTMGVIKVNPGEEIYYACELMQYEIVSGTHPKNIVNNGGWELF